MKKKTLLLVPDYSMLSDLLDGKLDVEIIGLDPMDRNDAFSPWATVIPSLKGEGNFGGHAEAFLEHVFSTLPENRELGILGLSLGALFGVYATIRKPVFSFCASISGSFWYPGWTDWLRCQDKSRTAYFFCSGQDEGRGRKDALKDSRSATDFTSSYLGGTYVTDEKGHMSYLKERTEECLSWIRNRLVMSN